MPGIRLLKDTVFPLDVMQVACCIVSTDLHENFISFIRHLKGKKKMVYKCKTPAGFSVYVTNCADIYHTDFCQ